MSKRLLVAMFTACSCLAALANAARAEAPRWRSLWNGKNLVGWTTWLYHEELGLSANSLTAQERASGWQLLFDGKTTAGWRNYNKPGLDSRWHVEKGALTVVEAGGGDIVTEQQFADFELSCEWKISPGGNSGIFFHVAEGAYDAVWRTGPEMQVLDDARHPDGRVPSRRAGAAYGLYRPRSAVTKPVGEFNHVRIVVDHGRVEHWLNGHEIVQYELGSKDWKRRVAESKFASTPEYGLIHSGHIALQDHGDRVWFRNIKIRPIKP